MARHSYGPSDRRAACPARHSSLSPSTAAAREAGRLDFITDRNSATDGGNPARRVVMCDERVDRWPGGGWAGCRLRLVRRDDVLDGLEDVDVGLLLPGGQL